MRLWPHRGNTAYWDCHVEIKAMEEFSGDSQCFKLPSLPFLAMDSTTEYTDHQFEDLNATVLNTPTFSLHRLMGFSSDPFLPQQPEFPDPFADGLWGFPNSVPAAQSVGSMGDENQESKKRKATEISNTSSGKSASQVSDIGPQSESDKANRKKCNDRGKKGKGNEKQEEGSKEVIHVRARRGQATDSHSLAERTMGMAVMLDEIINYVQSLQNQVEFLSMKLSAASYFYDFSPDMESIGALQTTV
ncbi:hypothetical protein ACLOJK_001305 [Asimina triloba]